MIMFIGKRTEIAWISDFFDLESKKSEIIIGKRTETGIKIEPL